MYIGTQVRLFVHLEGFNQVRVRPLGQSRRVAMAHSIFFLKKKNERLFNCGRRLQDVAASLQQGVEQPSELPMIGIVRHKIKRYLRNNLRPVVLQRGQSGSGEGLNVLRSTLLSCTV